MAEVMKTRSVTEDEVREVREGRESDDSKTFKSE